MTDKPLRVIAGSEDKPLVINDIEIPCYVVEGEIRVLSQGGMLTALGRHPFPRGSTGATSDIDKLPSFLTAKNLSEFITPEIRGKTNPIYFRANSAGDVAVGYRAELLAYTCNVYNDARDAGVLYASQEHIADRCRILQRGFSILGIIAIVDETTGYEEIREERALAKILEVYIAKELQPWTKTFDYEFYELIFSLKNWPGPDGVKRPSVIGHYTNDIVYNRLPPGLLTELRERNPVLPAGYRQTHHHRWFTPDYGHPKLKEHLAAVKALMRAAPNWEAFKRSLQRAFPKADETRPMHLGDE